MQVNMKALDDSALGRFWAEALGWEMSSEGPGVTNLEPVLSSGVPVVSLLVLVCDRDVICTPSALVVV